LPFPRSSERVQTNLNFSDSTGFSGKNTSH
jgi:hypothetical protein